MKTLAKGAQPASKPDDMTTSLGEKIAQTARTAGFDRVGFCQARDVPNSLAARLEAFLDNSWHGDMGWMMEKAQRRKHPKHLWDEVEGIIMLGLNYGPDHDPMENLAKEKTGNISVYARGRDYHDLVKKRLKQVARWINAEFETPVKVFVDTAPVMEKPLAELAGLGWQGKHTNLVSRDLGSWLFLGAIFTTLDLNPSDKEPDHCGRCRACLDVCPTKAFPAPYQLDARRCISYLTIEHKGPIPKEFRKPMGNRIYGCDDCLAVCPWNKYAETARDQAYFSREVLKEPSLESLLKLDDGAFRELFSGSPVKRTGRDRFIRNVLIAAGNSGDQSLTPQIKKLLVDPAPVVRGAAAWAFQQLADDKDVLNAKSRGLKDPDASVRAEWVGR